MGKYLEIGYIYVFFAIIWLPFQKFLLMFDAAGRTLTFLALLTLAYYIQRRGFRREMTSKPIVWWSFWVFYAFINTMIQGYSNENVSPLTFLFTLFSPLLAMSVVCYSFAWNRDRILNVFIAAGYVHLILVALFSSATEQGRFGVELDENYIGLSAVMLMFFMTLKNGYKKLTNFNLGLLSLAPLALIIMSGSRTAFGCCCILIAGALWAKRTKNTLVNFLTIGLLSILLYGGYIYVIENTYLGERLSMTTNQIETQNIDYQTGTFLDKLGDRGMFYYIGYQVFMKNPVFGIGLQNFRFHNESGLVQHSEYMTHLCELGIVGMLLFLLFYLWILKQLIRVWKKVPVNRHLTELYITGLFIILFLNFWYFSYFFVIFFCYFGLAIGYIKGQSRNLCARAR